MAKLSANGDELLRVVGIIDYITPTEAGVIREEVHFSYRSNGRILRRAVFVHGGPAGFGTATRRNDTGWKRHKRFPADIVKDPNKLREAAQDKAERYIKSVLANNERVDINAVFDAYIK